ncbi:Protein ULTRAPETALA 1 [Glycine soja]|uniref:Protein ULTRAPETALA 1 n=1 Tax=Glycine soja TaxID=3848 RepID=A0A0B2QE55_GLYSO|nr:Protein ULTRAPETALA 1 [Glycine soja]
MRILLKVAEFYAFKRYFSLLEEELKNTTKGDPPQRERSRKIGIKKKFKNIAQGPSKQRKQFRVGDDGKILFDEEELKMILDFKIGEDYIEFVCGATNKKYGDYVGRLKINNEGQYFITCECCPDCPLGKGVEGGRETSGFIAKTKTPLIKYYTHLANVANRKDSAMWKQNFHRDEFLRCTRCGKECRFHLKSRPDIKNYHDALTNKR